MNSKLNTTKRINRIIKEEIGEFILNEVADFQQLLQLNKTLYTLTNEMSKAMSIANLDPNRGKFVNNFRTYCAQIINAIKRCVKKQSINEWSIGGLSSYGINLPPQLGGNIYSDYLNGYHGMQNILLNGDSNNSNPKAKKGYDNNNGNIVKSVKLLVLLQNLQKWKQSYAQMNMNHEIDNQVPQVVQILGNNGVLDKIVQASQ